MSGIFYIGVMRVAFLFFMAFAGFFFQGFSQDVVPVRADSCFNFKLNYEFRQKSINMGTEVNYMERNPKSETDLLPWVELHIELECMDASEYRLRIAGNKGGASKTVKLSDKPVTFEIGFTEDVKARLVSHEYTLTVLDKKRNPINKILFLVEEDGTFLINGVVNGRF